MFSKTVIMAKEQYATVRTVCTPKFLSLENQQLPPLADPLRIIRRRHCQINVRQRPT
jgi:hypothetical protein